MCSVGKRAARCRVNARYVQLVAPSKVVTPMRSGLRALQKEEAQACILHRSGQQQFVKTHRVQLHDAPTLRFKQSFKVAQNRPI
jgi:hypothetical protein